MVLPVSSDPDSGYCAISFVTALTHSPRRMHNRSQALRDRFRSAGASADQAERAGDAGISRQLMRSKRRSAAVHCPAEGRLA